uniref:Uncharacterized protein n=1 Tax=Leersia perrieri TaxID=77586 RepID=A0A0D9WVL4_9ORYZ
MALAPHPSGSSRSASSPISGTWIDFEPGGRADLWDLRSIPEGYIDKLDGTEELGSLKYLSKVKNNFHVDTRMIKA